MKQITTIDFALVLDNMDLVPVLAIDPGETIGVVRLRTDADTHKMVLDYGHLSWPADTRILEELVASAKHVIIESFHLWPGKAKAKIGSTFPTVEVIGHIKGIMTSNGNAESLIILEASQSAVWKKHPLERLVRGKHARSALGLLLYQLTRKVETK